MLHCELWDHFSHHSVYYRDDGSVVGRQLIGASGAMTTWG